MAKVDRESLLAAVGAVSPGLARREVIEQSACLVFRGGEVLTFNEEVACRCPTGLPDSIEGAVHAERFSEMLRLLPEQEVDVSVTPDGASVLIKGKRRKSKHRWEAKVLLPVEHVEAPTDWSPLHPDFGEAVGTVQGCAEKDEADFSLACVRVHPDWVEACSNLQMCRWRVPTPVGAPCLVLRKAIRHVAEMGATDICRTPNWLHFKNPMGAVLSCRLYDDSERFPDLTPFLTTDGAPLALPESILEGVARATVCSADNADGDDVRVSVRAGRIKVVGEGVNDSYEEFQRFAYSGPDLDFLVGPKILADVVKRHRDCVVSADRLTVDAGRYVWTTCLTSATGPADSDSDNAKED